MKFENKTIVIFGGNSGIGAACVEYFRNKGATVFSVDKTPSSDEHAIQCDVTSLQEIKTSLQKINFIDIVVNCVGIYSRQNSISDFSEEEIQKTIQINLAGAIFVSQAVAPFLEKTQGSLIHISSSLALIPEKESAVYCATKAGLNMFVKSLALALADKNVRVNAVCPGPIDTPLLQNSFPDKLELKNYLLSRPLKRAGKPEEVAALVGFLSSKEASYITGGIYTIDGGESLI